MFARVGRTLPPIVASPADAASTVRNERVADLRFRPGPPSSRCLDARFKDRSTALLCTKKIAINMNMRSVTGRADSIEVKGKKLQQRFGFQSDISGAATPEPAPRVAPGTPPAHAIDRAFDRAALTGRLVEIPMLPDGAGITAALHVLRESQQLGDPVAYITTRDDLPFAEDLIALGLDLGAIVFVRAPDGPRAGLAADRLLRSSGFGAVIIDLATSHSIPVAQLGRLIRLVAIHDAVALVLTEDTTHGSLIAMRVHISRKPHNDGTWSIEYRAEKDKRLGPGQMRSIPGIYGPPGLR